MAMPKVMFGSVVATDLKCSSPTPRSATTVDQKSTGNRAMAFMDSTMQKMVIASGAMSGLDTCMLSLTLLSTIVTTPSAYFRKPVGGASTERFESLTATPKLTRNSSAISDDHNRLSMFIVQNGLSPNCQLQLVRWCWMYSVTVA